MKSFYWKLVLSLSALWLTIVHSYNLPQCSETTRADIANFNSNRNRRTFFRDAMVAAAGGSLLSTQVGFPNRASASGGATAGKYT